MQNYLLEIGLEEMPAHLVTSSIDQLEARMTEFLNKNRIPFAEIEKFSTPRRLALLVKNMAESSESMEEEVKGPSVKIAKDAEGNWSKAVEGFSRGQGLTPDDLVLNGDYYYAKKRTEGVSSKELLGKVGDEVIAKMTFSTYMKWGNNDFLFVRPIQWIVSLLENEVLAFDFLDLTAGRHSRGHRFLGNGELELSLATDYVEKLSEDFVLVDAKARKAEIVSQIEKIAQEKGFSLDMENEAHQVLLEEVNNIVEYPTAFLGSFEEKYLDLPAEVLVTSMRDNQRYFEAYHSDGKLAANFISVRDGNENHMENVIVGNEKVLLARLEDAKFFWEEDQKLQLTELVAKLDQVTFHAKIGSLSEHMARTKALAMKLAESLEMSAEEKTDLARAAEIYKFDLQTGMVNEFAELQGIMGEKYAGIFGENAAVAAAIREHYMPISADGKLPETKVGAVLAVADKLDTILSFFGAGLIPSGSNDPYALRRATAGIVRIIENQAWEIDLQDFIEDEAVIDFAKGRLAKILEKTVGQDIIEAALAVKNLKVLAMLEHARLLEEKKKEESFKPSMEAMARVMNLAMKEEVTVSVNPALFESPVEAPLYEQVKKAEESWNLLTADEKYSKIVSDFTPAISAFFEEVMVMVDDLAIKQNRLALLNSVMNLTRQMADFRKIVTK